MQGSTIRMRQNIDADLILTIAEQGFEGHLYDAIEKEKVVITFSGSEGGLRPVIQWPITIDKAAYLH